MFRCHAPARNPPGPHLKWRLLLLLALGGCGGGGVSGGGFPIGIIGSLAEKPGGTGELFFLDDHRAGARQSMRLTELTWGRMVDVFDLGSDGNPSPSPKLRRLVIDPNLLSDGVNYRLEPSPATGRERLIILRRCAGVATGRASFEQLLSAAVAFLPPVLPRVAGTSAGPFSLVPRNATIVLQFDDLLDDGPAVEATLADRLGLRVGQPPSTPFEGLLTFDPNHGGLAGGVFHSTRVLFAMTVSESEAALSPRPIPVNPTGLPPSTPGLGDANATLVIPTRQEAASGTFLLLRNLAGAPIDPKGSPPFDGTVPTLDLLRSFRTGNKSDTNLGYLLDGSPPRLLGSFGVEIVQAASVAGAPDRFRVDLEFQGPCRAAPSLGDSLEVGGLLFDVVGGIGSLAGSRALGVELRRLAGTPPAFPSALLGRGFLRLPYDAAIPIPSACWWTIIPEAGRPPSSDVSSFSSFQLRFDEPMVAGSFRAFDSMRLVRGGVDAKVTARSLVIASVGASRDLTRFTLTPMLPLDNRLGAEYRLELEPGPGSVIDLAGNTVVLSPPEVPFTLDPSEPAQENGGIAFRFTSLDEVDPFGKTDLRGQFTLDPVLETLSPRPVEFASVACDRFTGAVSVMLPFFRGVQTPLTPLGSRLQSMWRYVDFGWLVRDESKYNLDVTGMSWSPGGGGVLADFFPRFEMLVGHSRKLPDEECTVGRGPTYPDSGLGDGSLPFADNEIADPLGAMRTVHPESLGYRVDPLNAYRNEHQVLMLPFPWNHSGGSGPPVTYTWRDTALQALGGPMGAGLPMAIEEGTPLFVEESSGDLAGPDEVPSIGLPLLWEIRCFPTASGIGLNPLTIRLGCQGWPTPNFRAFSSGGVNVVGRTVQIDPSLAEFPTGGFNPGSNPPGKKTPRQADNSFYVGELDYVVRVSRVHTAWLDTQLLDPSYVEPVIEPTRSDLPPGTDVVFDYRGADGFQGLGASPFQADALDAYGELGPDRVDFHGPDSTWSSEVGSLDGARYFQVRISLIGDLPTGAVPVLDSLGFAYAR